MNLNHLAAYVVTGEHCLYCGGPTETRDHVPSKVFLDEPYPPQLPVVPCCLDCNQRFSSDELFVACVLECVTHGSTDLAALCRKKIVKAFEHSPALHKRIARARRNGPNGAVTWAVEPKRVRNVLEKLGRGHAYFETAIPFQERLLEVRWTPLGSLSSRERHEFYDVKRSWPEVADTIAMHRSAEAFPAFNGWIAVQEGRYRYAIESSPDPAIKMIIGEYLAGVVWWPEATT